ncbi:hypothetical protein [Kribbella sp. HUAS MG21]|jgi:hypothetical protein|uniref:Uncharacterized protein n=1 Tax=Kribbella sp. HUAS MG21 TaxID=3160966 RepID=A0AAU7TDI6_9ACTN
MGYELRALITRSDAILNDVDLAVVQRPEQFVLIPLTHDVFDRLGGGDDRPHEQQFWFLSGGIRDLALQLSRTAPVAYIEVEFFGGAGTQASIAWRDGQIIAAPAKHDFEAGVDALPRERWPVNAALAAIGATVGNAIDEFDALRLGQHRQTDDWLDLDR